MWIYNFLFYLRIFSLHKCTRSKLTLQLWKITWMMIMTHDQPNMKQSMVVCFEILDNVDGGKSELRRVTSLYNLQAPFANGSFAFESFTRIEYNYCHVRCLVFHEEWLCWTCHNRVCRYNFSIFWRHYAYFMHHVDIPSLAFWLRTKLSCTFRIFVMIFVNLTSWWVG